MNALASTACVSRGSERLTWRGLRSSRVAQHLWSGRRRARHRLGCELEGGNCLMPRLFLRSHTAPCCSQTRRPVTAACGFRRSGTYAPAAAIAARQLRGLPASLLTQIQLSDLIAGTGAEYVEVAAALARDPPAQRLTLIVAIARRGVPSYAMKAHTGSCGDTGL